MGFLDSLQDRFSTNLKLTQLSFMTQPQQIIAFCHGVAPSERAALIKGIESQFKWQSVAQIAQAMFPSYASGSGVSAEALDMALAGQVSGGLQLMAMQNQAPPTSWGLTPAQQAALSFAWLVLRHLDHLNQGAAAPGAYSNAVQAAGVPPDATEIEFCKACGTRRTGGRFCSHCGARF